MRDVAILKHAVAEPGVCCKCGSQGRDWFVDLGLDVEGKHAPGEQFQDTVPFVWFEGVLYLCDLCFNGMVADVFRKFPQFAEFHQVESYPHGLSRPAESNERDAVSSDRGTAENDSSSDEHDSDVAVEQRSTDDDPGPTSGFSLVAG